MSTILIVYAHVYYSIIHFSQSAIHHDKEQHIPEMLISLLFNTQEIVSNLLPIHLKLCLMYMSIITCNLQHNCIISIRFMYLVKYGNISFSRNTKLQQ